MFTCLFMFHFDIIQWWFIASNIISVINHYRYHLTRVGVFYIFTDLFCTVLQLPPTGHNYVWSLGWLLSAVTTPEGHIVKLDIVLGIFIIQVTQKSYNDPPFSFNTLLKNIILGTKKSFFLSFLTTFLLFFLP